MLQVSVLEFEARNHGCDTWQLPGSFSVHTCSHSCYKFDSQKLNSPFPNLDFLSFYILIYLDVKFTFTLYSLTALVCFFIGHVSFRGYFIYETQPVPFQEKQVQHKWYTARWVQYSERTTGEGLEEDCRSWDQNPWSYSPSNNGKGCFVAERLSQY